MPVPHPKGDYAITAMYSVPDDAWYLELELVADQQILVMAIIPDEDPAREPTVCFNPTARHVDIPYDVMRWFMAQVEQDVRNARAWMSLRPELVEVIHQLRQEYWSGIDDEEFPQVLAELRAAVPEADLAAVLAAAFGRKADGTSTDQTQAPESEDDQAGMPQER